MSSDPRALTFVVEDSFHIRGRGVVLAPAFEIDRFPRCVNGQPVPPNNDPRAAQSPALT